MFPNRRQTPSSLNPAFRPEKVNAFEDAVSLQLSNNSRDVVANPRERTQSTVSPLRRLIRPSGMSDISSAPTAVFNCNADGAATTCNPEITEAPNKKILSQYTKGKVKPRNVLKSTTAAIKGVNLKQAVACVEALKNKGITPDTIVYNALISKYKKHNDPDGALAVYDDMLARDVKPDVITYSALISTCANKGQINLALKFFAAMRENGVVPDVVTYTALISVCGKAKRGREALAVFEEMCADEIKPNFVTYSTLLSACDSDSELAKIAMPFFLERMIKDGFVAPSLGYVACTNTLNLRSADLLDRRHPSSRNSTINYAFVKAVFQYHYTKGHLSDQTLFSFEERRINPLKQVVAQCIVDCGWTPVQAIRLDGSISPNELYAQKPASEQPPVSASAYLIEYLHRNCGIGDGA